MTNAYHSTAAVHTGENTALLSSTKRGEFPTLVTLLRRGATLEIRGSTARDHLANERSKCQRDSLSNFMDAHAHT